MDAINRFGGAWKLSKIAQGAIHLMFEIVHKFAVLGNIIDARLDKLLPGMIEEAVFHSLRSWAFTSSQV